jgi:hypothetical protein
MVFDSPVVFLAVPGLEVLQVFIICKEPFEHPHGQLHCPYMVK